MVLVLSETEVRACIDIESVLSELKRGFISLSDGGTRELPRGRLDVAGGGYVLTMLAEIPDRGIGCKTAAIFPDVRARGLPTHHAVTSLFDGENGGVLAVMSGAVLGAVRTAAAVVLSIQVAAREPSGVVAVIGGGVQARSHVEVIAEALEPAEIRVFARDPARTRELASLNEVAVPAPSLQAAVWEADIVSLCTRPAAPFLTRSMISEGTHVTSIGAGEVSPDLVAEARILVEADIALSPPPIGCRELEGMQRHDVVLLGDVLAGREAGRNSGTETTLYKSMGHAVEDVAIAHAVLQRASHLGVGYDVDF